ncbi:hypothetical protein BT67DRAFT_148835 [Trichocladium antarcticum]|uniref:Uncharacterized protein n=1 Tax=Trichocladium antarcticum TaxID=1450529 RepID=A0AAN6ZBU9_9PEZI|nr:hypothetical protein BT67DRAFT_148835 [Trichocladium antarcticum]
MHKRGHGMSGVSVVTHSFHDAQSFAPRQQKAVPVRPRPRPRPHPQPRPTLSVPSQDPAQNNPACRGRPSICYALSLICCEAKCNGIIGRANQAKNKIRSK